VVTIDAQADTVEMALIAHGSTKLTGRDGSGGEVAGQLISPPRAPVRRYRVAGHAIGDITITLEECAALLSIIAEGAGRRRALTKDT
jgi:hypothetical protein